jgi:hypothetical protein
MTRQDTDELLPGIAGGSNDGDVRHGGGGGGLWHLFSSASLCLRIIMQSEFPLYIIWPVDVNEKYRCKPSRRGVFLRDAAPARPHTMHIRCI